MAAVTVGVSLKAYFGRQKAREWFAHIAERVHADEAAMCGTVEVFVIPTYLQIDDAVAAFAGTPVRIGAQDVSVHPAGAFTGEIPAAELVESGVQVVEVGHAERRRLFGETDQVVAAKAAVALSAGLIPVVCVGEGDELDPAEAAAATVDELREGLRGAPAGRVIIAYEPVWAIGAPEPAAAAHITAVARALRVELDATPGREGSSVIYGGSAGPGLFTRLDESIDGLFLGRFAHDPAAFAEILDEAATRAAE